MRARMCINCMLPSLVDDQQTVYRRVRQCRMTFRTRFGLRKLFNAIAVMQQVEQGKIDLDSPIQSYGPQFNLVNPFEGSRRLRYASFFAIVPA